MKRFSHILGFFLASVIAVTAQSAARARTMPDASGQMVICLGSTTMLVRVDANGEPMDAPQLCPECTLSLILALEHVDVFAAPCGAWFSNLVVDVVQLGATLRLGAPNARGPPVSM